MGIFHTLALNLKDWLFDVIVTWPFRPKSVDLNENVHCKPIDITLKMLFNEDSLSTTNHFRVVMQINGFGIKKT